MMMVQFTHLWIIFGNCSQWFSWRSKSHCCIMLTSSGHNHNHISSLSPSAWWSILWSSQKNTLPSVTCWPCPCVSLEVSFEDVIAEPPSVRSFDKVWLWSHALFEVTRLWCYCAFTLLLAVPVSLASGLLFAVLSCLHIWWDYCIAEDEGQTISTFMCFYSHRWWICGQMMKWAHFTSTCLCFPRLIMPCVQILLISMHWVQSVWGSSLNIFISPFFTSIGKCCGGINIRLARD